MLGISQGICNASDMFGTLHKADILKNLIHFLLVSKQLAALKQVCKHWNIYTRLTLQNIPYLKLEKNVAVLRTVMAIAPVDSSGDIYQLLAFTILSIRERKQVPPILLTYDNDKTKKQVERSYNFASLLGYEGYFYKMRVPYNNSTQPVSRQRQLIDKLKDREINWYIDNRLSTTIISDCIREYGFNNVTDIIRGGLKEWNINLLGENNNEKINKYVESQIAAIKKVYNKTNNPTIVIHYRYSGAANKKQNMCELVPLMIDWLKQDNYNLVCIYTDSRKKKAARFNNINVHIEPFKDAKSDNSVDTSKLYHLKLLIRLFEERRDIGLVGIIGNTSGTLDLAALIGHNVFNIHKFSTPITYQDYRIMLQTPFLNIQNGNEILLNEKANEKFYENLTGWADSNYKLTSCNSLITPNNFKGMMKVGFYSLSSVMYVNPERWFEQTFFINLKDYVDNILIDLGFFKTVYDSPIDIEAKQISS